MAYSEDHIALAAEYALGTLDAAERAQVETMMVVDRDFAALVQAWELRLGALNQMVGLVEPRPELWDRIKAAIAQSLPAAVAATPATEALAPEAPAVETPAAEPPAAEPPAPDFAAPVVVVPPEVPAPDAPPVIAEARQDEAPKLDVPAVEQQPVAEPTQIKPSEANPRKPEAPPIEIAKPEPATAAEAPAVVAPRRTFAAAQERADERANVVQLSSRVRQWRAVANVMTALAAVLLALVGVQVYRPDLLPQPLQPKPRIQTVEVKVPAAPEPAAQFVALLQKDAASPAFILTVDSATRSYTVRRVGAAPEPGKSFELWIVSDKLQKPRSLGVIGGSDFTSRPVLSSYDPDIVSRATYAVTVEPEGGSPTGQATGPIVFTGKLIETVPPGK
ncbi:anti-sigma factor [Bradyrhizobium sp. HKCCYLR20261]|uniref:anti-sigma factor n=1 Tax=Bradyrhizobium sp. HKCCYLR20261 TaxID=3420760 RepID=UPI003EBF6FBE